MMEILSGTAVPPPPFSSYSHHSAKQFQYADAWIVENLNIQNAEISQTRVKSVVLTLLFHFCLFSKPVFQS